MSSLKAVSRVTQEDHAQHRHEVVARGELRVSAEVVSRLPQIGFELLDVLESLVGHDRVVDLSSVFIPTLARLNQEKFSPSSCEASEAGCAVLSGIGPARLKVQPQGGSA